MQVADESIGHSGWEDVMTPPSGRKPLPPRLLNQLAVTLRALEGPRQGEVDEDASVSQALVDLAELEELVAGMDDASLPDGIPGELTKAREALDGADIDQARAVLVGVGRSIDAFLKG